MLTQLRRGALEYCVLALLSHEERYVLDLVRVLSETKGLVTTEGTLYPLLSRLRREGFVATQWRESVSGPPRRYYTLTRDGRRALERFTSEWQCFRDAVDELLNHEGEG